MDSLDEALDRVRSWKDRGATLELTIDGPAETRFKLSVRVLNVTDSSIALAWSTDTFDSPPKRSFAHSDGTTVISLEDALFVISRDSTNSLSISRGAYRCLLREIRASAFQE